MWWVIPAFIVLVGVCIIPVVIVEYKSGKDEVDKFLDNVRKGGKK